MGELRRAARVLPRLLRTRWARWPGAAMVVVAAFLIVAYVTVMSWGLSQDQVHQRDHSGFEADVSVTEDVTPGRSTLLSAIREGAETSPVVLVTTDVRLTADPERRLHVRETDWTSATFGYHLVSGRWPERPGEVVVTDGLVPGGDRMLSLLSGSVEVRVVGVVRDDYSSGAQVLAGPGTWESWGAAVRRARPGLVASARILASRTEARRIAADLSRHRIGTSVLEAQEVRAEQTWIASSPFAFVVPAILVPLLATSLGAAAGRSRQRALTRRVVEVGGRGSTALGLVTCILVATTVIGVAVGLLAGWVAGHAVRPLIQIWDEQVLAPYPSLLRPAVLIAASSVGGLAVGLLPLRDRPAPRKRLPEGSRPVLRRWGALLTAATAVVVVARIRSAGEAMVLGALAVVLLALLAPEIVSMVARWLDRPSPHLRLGARQLVSDRGAALEVVLTMLLVTLPLVTMIMLTATGESARAETLAGVGPRQLLVAGHGGLGTRAPAEVRTVVSEVLRSSEGVTSTELLVTDTTWYEVTNGNASVIAVADPDDVEDVWGAPLSPLQRETLEHGGALVWVPGAEMSVDGRPARSIKTTAYQPTEEWAHVTGAVMLAGPAREQGVTLRPGGTVHAHVTEADGDRVLDALRERGLDQGLVTRYHPPGQLLPPTALIASALTLTVLMVGVTATASHARTSSLRRQFGRMLAVGADRGFVRRVHVVNQSTTTAIALVGASLVTALSVASLLLRVQGSEVRPPWLMISALLVALVAAQSAAALIALRRLRPELHREG